MILHVDMDAYYASVEERDNPHLRGKPLVVGGSENSRGVVSAANYAARQFGVRSAMPMATALKRCPQLIRLPARIDYYADISQQIRAIFARYTPQIEPLSLDEAFLDVQASEKIFGSSATIGHRIKQDILDECGLIASVGVAPNKFIAKIASDADKPDGFVIVKPHQVQSFLDPLPISRLWGVGKTGERLLRQQGIRTFADVRHLPAQALIALFGSWGGQLHQLARGIDDRTVVTDWEAKSISNETTFARDIKDKSAVLTVLLRLTEQVAYRLRAAERSARTVQIKARFSNFKTITRSMTLAQASQDTQVLWQMVKQLAQTKLPDRYYRLLGVGVSQLQEPPRQNELFSEPKQHILDETADRIKEKFGKLALFRAGYRKND